MADVGADKLSIDIIEAVREHGDMKVFVTTGVGQLRPATGVEVVIMRDEINVPILVIEAIEGK